MLENPKPHDPVSGIDIMEGVLHGSNAVQAESSSKVIEFDGIQMDILEIEMDHVSESLTSRV